MATSLLLLFRSSGRPLESTPFPPGTTLDALLLSFLLKGQPADDYQGTQHLRSIYSSLVRVCGLPPGPDKSSYPQTSAPATTLHYHQTLRQAYLYSETMVYFSPSFIALAAAAMGLVQGELIMTGGNTIFSNAAVSCAHERSNRQDHHSFQWGSL